MCICLYNIFTKEEQIKKTLEYEISFNIKQVMVYRPEKKTTKTTS